MRTMISALTAIVITALTSIPLSAQTFSGLVTETGAGIVARPLKGATVRLSPINREVYTNSSGAFAFTNLPVGTYTYQVTVSAPGHTTVTETLVISGNTVRNYNLVINGEPQLHTITGTVAESGATIGTRPLAGALVHLLGSTYSARTDVNGRFTLASVPTGTYTVEVSAAGHRTEHRQIRVTANMSVSFTLPLLDGSTPAPSGRHTLSGTVLQDGPGIDPRALAGATVRLMPGNYTATTDGAGRFTLSGIPSGSYTMQVKAAGHRPLNRRVSIAANRSIDLTLQMNSSRRVDRDDDDDDDDDSRKKNGKGKKGKGKRGRD